MYLLQVGLSRVDSAPNPSFETRYGGSVRRRAAESHHGASSPNTTASTPLICARVTLSRALVFLQEWCREGRRIGMRLAGPGVPPASASRTLLYKPRDVSAMRSKRSGPTPGRDLQQSVEGARCRQRRYDAQWRRHPTSGMTFLRRISTVTVSIDDIRGNGVEVKQGHTQPLQVDRHFGAAAEAGASRGEAGRGESSARQRRFPPVPGQRLGPIREDGRRGLPATRDGAHLT